MQEQAEGGFTPTNTTYDPNQAYLNYLEAIEQVGPHIIPPGFWIRE